MFNRFLPLFLLTGALSVSFAQEAPVPQAPGELKQREQPTPSVRQRLCVHTAVSVGVWSVSVSRSSAGGQSSTMN